MNISTKQLKQQIEALEKVEKLGEGQKMLFPCRDIINGESGQIVYELQPSEAPGMDGELVWVLNLNQSEK